MASAAARGDAGGVPRTACASHTLVPRFVAETALERALLCDPDLRAGLAWGSARFGHPEGTVGRHVAAILDEIDPAEPLRRDLRVLALVHDSQKVRVDPAAGWSPGNDHARLARRLAERHLCDERLLCVVELHDEPYWIWRSHAAPEDAVAALLRRMPDVALFARFVELDAATEGKDPSFLWWFQRQIAAFLVQPADQSAVARAAADVVRACAQRLRAQGRVLVSEDGLRVLLVWRWFGHTPDRLLADGEVVAAATRAHPELAAATALEAHLSRSQPER